MNKAAPSLSRIIVMVVFALSCFGLLLFLWLSFGGPVPLKPKGYQVRMDFPEATTLATEADVRVAGVPVGKVRKVEVGDGTNRTVATVELERRYAPLRSDARATLRQKTLLGETYVELTPGRSEKMIPEGGKLAEWSAALANLAAVADDERVRVAVGDPNLSAAKVAGLFVSILAGKLSGDAENFVRVLAENGRLDVLGQIREQYEALKNEREGVVEAEVVSAFEMDKAQVADLVARLEKKTGRKVKARVSVDRDLIGGVKVVLGDKVIDGSARAQLGALEAALKA